jgi:hypothetical protein
MDTTLIIFAVIFGIVGVIGCVLPMIPGGGTVEDMIIG